MSQNPLFQPLELSVVVPCFNECDHLEAFLRSWLQFLLKENISFEFIVINDGSTDGSGRILDNVRREFKELRVFHQLRCGHGGAIRRGYEAARGKFVLQLDANGRYEPQDFLPVWEQRTTHSLVLGKRIHRIEPLFGRMLSYGLKKTFQTLTGEKIEDPNSPFRLFLRQPGMRILSCLPKQSISANLSLTAGFMANGNHVVEVAIPYRLKSRRRKTTLFKQINLVSSLLRELALYRREITLAIQGEGV